MSKAIIEIENLNFSYPGQNDLLRDLTLKFELGQIIFISGPNGSGKTTLIRLLLGLNFPQTGILNIPKALQFSYQSAARSGFYENLTGKENLILWSTFKKICATQFKNSLIKWEKLDIFKRALNTKYQNCSNGMRGILTLFQALELASDSQHIVCLDEPLAHLDQITTNFLIEVLKNKNKSQTIIFTGHHIPAELLTICHQHINLSGDMLAASI